MCLAIPLKLLAVSPDGREGSVDMGGAEKSVGLDLVPEARAGDFVLVHAGMAIHVIDEAEAEQTLKIFQEFAQFPDLIAPPEKSNPFSS
jgi:hydrogenase expression/formation protein HypC